MKKNKIKIIVIASIILIALIIWPSYGRYIYNEIRDVYFSTKNFYFNSDKLTSDRKIYVINNWSGVDTYNITINLNNQKNSLVNSDSDIEYEIGYSCSLNAICSVSKNGGTIYTDSGNDYYNITLAANGFLQNNEEIWIETYAKSTYPYEKRLSARFILKVGIPSVSHEIDDEANRPFFNLSVTNSTDFYVVKENFGDYVVNQRIDSQIYMGLSEEQKSKCALPLITLSFNPLVTILDMTSSAFLNAENYTTTRIGNYDYVNSISFRINLESSETIKFYKADTTHDYTYPIINDTSVVNFSYSQ